MTSRPTTGWRPRSGAPAAAMASLPAVAVMAVLAVLAVLAIGGLSGCTSAPDRRAAVTTAASPATQQNAADPGADPSVAREEALSALLARRAAALTTRDRAAFAETLDDPGSGFGQRQLAMYEAVAQLPLATFSYGTPEPAPALGRDRAAQVGPQAWVSRVSGRYSLAGFDTAQREFESYFTVVRRDDAWKLADDSDGGTQPQLWDLPRLTVVRSRTTLVVGSGPASRLRPYLALGDLAVRRVEQVWTPRWNRRLVLVVPATTGQMAEQVGQDKGDVGQVAAVTDGPFDATGRAGADRVVVNPGAFATLQSRGQQVVVTHEATHVAIRAGTNRPVPLWLSEGMADYVGYRDVGATPQQVAAQLLHRVRAGKGPRALPGAQDFDPSRATIAPSYNAAWLAVGRIAERYGRSALVRFYLAAATNPDPTKPPGDAEANTRAAFGSVLHTSEAAFTKDWLRHLDEVAGR